MMQIKDQSGPVREGFGNGEVAQHIAALDWSGTPLGPVEGWSPALRMMVRMLQANRFPQLLWWGPDYISIYNDSYRPILGTKHPWALGRPVRECWSEIWHVLQPLIDTPFHGGPSTWNDDITLEINRHGFVEETHFTIAYSPVPDETVSGGIGGVLATVTEITGKVIGERRIVALRDLGARAGEAKTAEEACAIAAQTLAAHTLDVPFVLFYLVEPGKRHARRAGVAGVTVESDFAPLRVDLADHRNAAWPLALAHGTGTATHVTGLRERFSPVPQGPWSDAPDEAVVVTIPSNRPREPAGLMVVGLSARSRWDEPYRGFVELLTTQVATAIANARAYEVERKRAEELAELDRAKTAFFANVSHELRTPLTLILGPIEDALAEAGSHAERERLEMLRRNALRLQKLVNTLLDFSRIEAGRVQASYRATDLAALTTELASVFRSAVERAGLRLVVRCEAAVDPVHVDRDGFEKIVFNLLSNALKFTLHGEIEVGLRDAGANVQLWVRDTGVGIARDQLAHVFERFGRVENSAARTHEGTGIGLALVRELAKLHGGNVEVSSVPGAGSTFTVTLPKGSAHLPPEWIAMDRQALSPSVTTEHFVQEALQWLPDAKRAGDVLPSGATAGEVRPRIVWADDNGDMRDYVRRLLASVGEVEAVADGQAALEAVQRQRPDLVLADVMMPRLDGFGLLRALRDAEATRTLPVILLSARAGEEARVEGMQAGADDYLVKPFGARELLARVRAHLDMARVRREAADALRESEQRFRTLFESMEEGYCVLDVLFDEQGRANDLRFVDGNPAFHAQTGLADVTGRSIREIALDLEPHWFEVYGDVASSGRTRRFEYQAAALGRHYDVCAFRVGAAELRRVGVLFNDVTERRKAEEALLEMDRRKDEFLATLAHELRNPLAPLRNSLHILQRTTPSGAVDRVVEMMERQVNHMVRLVDDLMEVSRITRGKIELRKVRCDLAEVARSAVETSMPLIEAGRHRLDIDLPAESLVLDADPVRLAQVITNLLNNAAKYTSEGGRIRLSVRREGSTAIVSVRDNGIGIPLDMQARVFDMFAQLDTTHSRAQGGLGIGLTLVRSLVGLHGGSIEVASAGAGKGSEFVARLPLPSTQDSWTGEVESRQLDWTKAV